MTSSHRPGSRMSREKTVPMQCSTCTVRGGGAGAGGGVDRTTVMRGGGGISARLVERALERGDVALAGVGRAADTVDLRAVRGDRLLLEGRDRVGVDLLVAPVVLRVDDGGGRGDLPVGQRDLDLHRAPTGVDRAA